MKTKLLFVTSILLLISCKSSEFKMKMESINVEISNLMKEISIQNNRKIDLTKNLINLASAHNAEQNSTLKLIVENANKMYELNSELVEKQLSKEIIIGYFQELNNQTLILNALFEKLDKHSEFSVNQNYTGLRNVFESQNNRTLELMNQYNSILEKNFKYVDYPKFDIIQFQ